MDYLNARLASADERKGQHGTTGHHGSPISVSEEGTLGGRSSGLDTMHKIEHALPQSHFFWIRKDPVCSSR